MIQTAKNDTVPSFGGGSRRRNGNNDRKPVTLLTTEKTMNQNLTLRAFGGPALLSRARQRGISLIEGILYLVLALSLVVGGIILFQNAQLSNRVTETARGVVAIASETRALYQNSPSFGTAELNETLIASGAVPLNFQSDGGIRHPWGGDVTVTGDDQQFTISLAGIPEDACIRISTVDASGQGTLGVGITQVDFDTVAEPVLPDGVDINDATANCADGTNLTVTYAR